MCPYWHAAAQQRNLMARDIGVGLGVVSALVLLAAWWNSSTYGRSNLESGQQTQHTMGSSRTTEEHQGLYDELGIAKQIEGLEKIELLKKLECMYLLPNPTMTLFVWPAVHPTCCSSPSTTKVQHMLQQSYAQPLRRTRCLRRTDLSWGKTGFSKCTRLFWTSHGQASRSTVQNSTRSDTCSAADGVI